MNYRDQIKNILVSLWPQSKLSPDVLGELLNRLAGCRLPVEQIDALLRAHRMECEKASWSPFPPDIFKRINAVRASTGAVRKVDTTKEQIETDVNEMRWARMVNTQRRDRVIAAIECMDMADVDGFVIGKLPDITAIDDAKFAREMWAEAKDALGKPETWTPDRLANNQKARIVLCRCLGISLATPKYDPKKVYQAVSNPAGTDGLPSLAEIGSGGASAPQTRV